MKNRVVIAIYIDPDFYPPTINAILNLAEKFDQVIVISRNNADRNFPYPDNVQLKKIGPKCTVRQMEKQSLFKKVFYFLKFVLTLLKFSVRPGTRLLLIYDSIALYAWHLTRRFLRNKKVWYHNHDMQDKNAVSKFSIGGLAAKNEEQAMKYIQFFTLPSKERLIYFTKLKKNISTFIIPNYPSLKVYKKNKKNTQEPGIVKIIYQGFIGTGHSLEELIALLPVKLNGNKLELILKGSVTNTYRAFLQNLAVSHGVENQLHWLPIGPYIELPVITREADIGIGINMNTDIVSQAQGTASNKIYEYSASGLPVLLYSSGQFKKYLSSYDWTFFTDGTLDSLKTTIEQMIDNLKFCSSSARKDFENELNFEKVFQPVMNHVIQSLEISS